MSQANDHPIAELLAGEVLGDLSESERVELDRLKKAMSKESLSETSRELESAAAALQGIGAVSSDGLPNALAELIREGGYRSLRLGGAEPKISVHDQESRNEDFVQPISKVAQTNRLTRRETFAWAMVAATLLLSIFLWGTGDEKEQSVAKPTLQEIRSDLMSLPDVTNVVWTDGKTPFDFPVTGDVVWDTKSQTGVMRFVGMPVNDRLREQYQLWIIDPQRDDEPIDGGVFDISDEGEVFVAINPKLEVIEPAAFAITVEKPGGVVVSTQERLPLLAAVN